MSPTPELHLTEVYCVVRRQQREGDLVLRSLASAEEILVPSEVVMKCTDPVHYGLLSHRFDCYPGRLGHVAVTVGDTRMSPSQWRLCHRLAEKVTILTTSDRSPCPTSPQSTELRAFTSPTIWASVFEHLVTQLY